MNKIIIIPVSFCYSFFKNSASERFRCDWLLPYLPADKYDGSQNLANYDVIIYQKAHSQEMVELSKKYKNKIQILDSTDPEWLFPEGKYLKEIIENMTFLTTSTESLKKGWEQFKKPVYIIPDRHDFSFYKVKKVHEDKLPTLVWFGYNDSFNRIFPLWKVIQDSGLPLITICEKPTDFGEFILWEKETVNENIIKGDVVLNLPDAYGFKSNNKTTTAWALGMPVVEKIVDFFKFINYQSRIKESDFRYKYVREHYDIKQSAEELKNLIIKYSQKNKVVWPNNEKGKNTMKFLKVEVLNPPEGVAAAQAAGRDTMIYPSGYNTLNWKASYINDKGKTYVLGVVEDETQSILTSLLASPQVTELTKEDAIILSESTQKREEIITNEAVVRRLAIKAALGTPFTAEELKAIDPTDDSVPGFGTTKILADKFAELSGV